MIPRVLSAVIMVLAFVAAVCYAPALIYKGIVLLAAMGGLYEFFKLTLPSEPPYQEAGWIWGTVLAAVLLFFDGKLAILGVLIFGLFFIALIQMKYSTVLESTTSRIGLTMLGVLYISLTIPFWGLLRELPHGRALIFLGVAGAALSDTFAMLAGKLFGRHKFAPLTSPNKTMEGFIVGFFGSILGVWAVKIIEWPELPLKHVLTMGAVIGFIGPFGDLIESLFKRDLHVKDSGSIIPGHGGILDRLDALIFVGPFVYLYAKYFL